MCSSVVLLRVIGILFPLIIFSLLFFGLVFFSTENLVGKPEVCLSTVVDGIPSKTVGID